MKPSDQTISKEVLENAPRVNMSRRQLIQGLAAGTVVPIVASGCATNPETGRNQLMLVSEGQIAQMAASAWTDMKRQTPISRDRGLNTRVNRIMDKIAVSSNRSDQEWELQVFDTDDVNAFVMPGNKVGVYRGLTEMTENDDQIATVIGHEVGHVVGRHSAERFSQQILGQVALVGAQIAVSQSESLKQYGQEIAVLGGAALQFGVLLPYSRQHEYEADRLGVDYMYRAGYQVKEAPRLWDLMDARSQGQRPLEFMSTHPYPQNRKNELVSYINARGYDLV